MKFKKGFAYGKYMYGWYKKELYRLPKYNEKYTITLKKLKLVDVGVKKGYCVGGKRKSLSILEKLTTDINIFVPLNNDENCPF